MYFVIANAETKLGKAFWENLGTKKNKVRIASPSHLEFLKGEQGALSVFNAFNDHEKKIKHLVFDENLMKETHWSFHPMVNTMSIEVKKDDILELLKSNEKEYQVIDLE